MTKRIVARERFGPPQTAIRSASGTSIASKPT